MSLIFLYPPKVLGGLQSLNSYGVPRFRVHVVVTYMVKVAWTIRWSNAYGMSVSHSWILHCGLNEYLLRNHEQLVLVPEESGYDETTVFLNL